MKKQALTARQVQYMKPSASRLEVPAGPPAGLYLVVHTTGRKTWAFRYRWKGATRKLTLEGHYPEMTLAAARAEAEAARRDLDEGVDPAVEKALEKTRPDSVPAVVTEFISRKVKGTRTHREVVRILKREIVPPWKHRTIDEIRRVDVMRVLDAISDRGAPAMANKVLSVTKRLFGWCVERGILEVSPVVPLRTPNKERSRDRVLSDVELTDIWAATECLAYPLGPFYQFLILTAQRRGEVAGLEWQDVDLEGRLWTLPPEKTKPGRVHDVPLSAATVPLLENLPRFEGSFVFTTAGGRQPINGFSKGKVGLDRQIAELRKKRGHNEDVPKWRVHDLRRTAATWMAGTGVPPHVLSALLNHSPGTGQGVTHIYNRFRYLEERREALQMWSDHVLRSVGGSRVKNQVFSIGQRVAERRWIAPKS